MAFATRLVLVSVLFAAQSFAATIQYVVFPPNTDPKAVSNPIVVTLPCYGDVRVSVSPMPGGAQYTKGTAPFVNQPRTVGPHSWTNADGFGMFLGSHELYDVTFEFLNGVPDSSRLILAVTGLLSTSKATLSTPATWIGELTIPANQLNNCPWEGSGCPNGTAPTKFTSGTTFGSNYSSTPGTDGRNTGWALVHPQINSTKMTLSFDHEGGDGLGWSLGYLCDPGLTVKKDVKGAPAGFKGTFSFLVECMTKGGLVSKTVSVDWPSPGTASVAGIPTGSTCKVTENAGLPPAPEGMIWSTATYAPENGVVVTKDGANVVTAVNTLRPCRDKCEVRIIKKVEGAPPGFTGTFTGTLRCWINGALTPFPVKLDYPTPATYTVPNLPLGTSCTFEETGSSPLPPSYQWLPPIYSKEFGQILLVGTCTHELVVTNRAKFCCP